MKYPTQRRLNKKMSMLEGNFLVVFHTPANAGYAMAPLEKAFFNLGVRLTGSPKKVHFAYKDLSSGMPATLPEDFENVFVLNYSDSSQRDDISKYIAANDIRYAFCFDLQVNSSAASMMRKAGIKKIVAYWGATISGVNSGLKLFIKKVEVFLRRDRPDHFIFESEAMRYHATHGRGIHLKHTSVIPTGVDCEKYSDKNRSRVYLGDQFGIPEEAFVLFYSGHMERRKGVHVIIEAVKQLVDAQSRKDVYLLIVGNKEGEEAPFLKQLEGSIAINNVVFGGYRSDLELVMPACDVGVIASTGWDSFPMSSLEMASCGLPLIVSDLQGLAETIENEQTGYLFEPGNSSQLVDLVLKLKSDEGLRKRLGANGRARVVEKYSNVRQLDNLYECCQSVFSE